ncbi:MAG: amino-acid N-acetyltransferase [Candidatus Nanopelagicales bacterium]
MSAIVLRPARTADVQVVRRLVSLYTEDGRLLAKAPVTLYEDVQEFLVAEIDGVVVGCGALHVMWEDLGEIRTLAVDPDHKRQGIGGRILDQLVERARDLGLTRLFCLTFETDFFEAHGFHEIEGSPVDHQVFEQLLQSYDEGVAEFLDLERVKPNTLGNHRMLRVLG